MENSQLVLLSCFDRELYKYVIGDDVVGFILLKSDNLESVEFYIEIFEKYRGNGYGGRLFKEIITIFKNKNISKVTVFVSSDNFKMINILENNKSLLVSNNNGLREYLIPVCMVTT